MMQKPFNERGALWSFYALLAVLAFLLVIFGFKPAFAQEAAKPVIDFTPILNELILAAATVVSAAAFYGVKLLRDYLKAKTGVELQISDEKVREVLDRAIQYGTALVVGKLDGKTKLTISNAQVAQIANYVIAATPDALAQFGITPERLQDMIRARLVAWSEGRASAEKEPEAKAGSAEPAPAA